MPATHVSTDSNVKMKLQSAALFVACMQRTSTLARLTGQLPKQPQAEAGLRAQSSIDYPIVVCRDLQKMPGDEITFDLINHIGGKPIMGSDIAEGKGEALRFDQDRLRIQQTRKPINAGDTMSQQRTAWQLNALARSALSGYMNRFVDQMHLVHLAGARGFHDNIEWAVPLASDPDFSKIVVNTVRAPTRNRHFMSTGSGIELVSASAGELAFASTDVMNIDVLDSIRTWVDGVALPPPPCKFEGDVMAEDAPLRVLLVSSEQYTSIAKSTNFRTLQAQAIARAQKATNSPLFLGDVGLWNGILVVKMPKPIRFYAGNPINYCASYTSATETTSDVVPAAFGTTYGVDRALLLGSQALAYALGKSPKSGSPFFWSEKEYDHGDKLEILIGMVNGMSKIRFLVDYGASGDYYTDHGVVAIDTVVALTNGV